MVVMWGKVGNSRPVWAWATVEPNTPGFRDIYYTLDDGMTFTDVGEELPRLERTLFTIPDADPYLTTTERPSK